MWGYSSRRDSRQFLISFSRVLRLGKEGWLVMRGWACSRLSTTIPLFPCGKRQMKSCRQRRLSEESSLLGRVNQYLVSIYYVQGSVYNETLARAILDWWALGDVVWFASLPHPCCKELTFNETHYSWMRNSIFQNFSKRISWMKERSWGKLKWMLGPGVVNDLSV